MGEILAHRLGCKRREEYCARMPPFSWHCEEQALMIAAAPSFDQATCLEDQNAQRWRSPLKGTQEKVL